ncbi:MAG: class I SAM-dependent methyltransferase [Thermodesulfobacteriota bacterium]
MNAAMGGLPHAWRGVTGLNCDFNDLFSSVSANYSDFRPTYPATIFAWLARIAPGRGLAWDCGTGNGQAAIALASHFTRVVATDASRNQIERALPHPRIEYRVASAECSGLAARSVDLITVAQALHWFDTELFFAEARRVLAGRGVLAVWSYGALTVEGEEVDAEVQRFSHAVVGPFWPPERALVEAGYRDILLPFARLEAPDFTMAVRWSLDQLLGYLGTWSATSRYTEAMGHDPVGLLRPRLVEVWGEVERRRKVVWPLVLLAGRR